MLCGSLSGAKTSSVAQISNPYSRQVAALRCTTNRCPSKAKLKATNRLDVQAVRFITYIDTHLIKLTPPPQLTLLPKPYSNFPTGHSRSVRRRHRTNSTRPPLLPLQRKDRLPWHVFSPCSHRTNACRTPLPPVRKPQQTHLHVHQQHWCSQGCR